MTVWVNDFVQEGSKVPRREGWQQFTFNTLRLHDSALKVTTPETVSPRRNADLKSVRTATTSSSFSMS